jgi:predicted nucleotidyltransferase
MKINNNPTQFPELNELLVELVEKTKNILGDNFVGAYLQGSAALGALDMQSDCDFIIVIKQQLTLEQEEQIRKLHDEIATRQGHWVHHIEGSYAVKGELRTLDALGKEWLFNEHGNREMLWATHCNSEVVRWILREHGVTIVGPDPKEFINKVDSDTLRARMRKNIKTVLPDILTWIGMDSPWAQRYTVTTLCRTLYTIAKGEVGSKKDSLLWAKENLDPKWQALIIEALEGRSLGWNHSDPIKQDSIEQIHAFNEYAKQQALVR